jgi:hypothetical protein
MCFESMPCNLPYYVKYEDNEAKEKDDYANDTLRAQSVERSLQVELCRFGCLPGNKLGWENHE